MARNFLRSDDESLGELMEGEKWKEVQLRLEMYPSEAREWHMVRNFFGPRPPQANADSDNAASSIGSKGSTDEEDSEEDSEEGGEKEPRNESTSDAPFPSATTAPQNHTAPTVSNASKKTPAGDAGSVKVKNLPSETTAAKKSPTVKSEVLPLHVACARRPPRNVIAALLTTYTHAIQCKETSYQRLPLHIACRYGSSASVIRLLLEYFPHAALVKDKLGRLPLHYACGHRATPEVIKLLMSGNVRVVTVADVRGWLPLHVACAAGASTQVVRTLIRPYPEAVVAQTNKNRTPLRLVHEGNNRRSKSQLFRILVDAEATLSDKNSPKGFEEKEGFKFKGANRALRRGRRMLRDMSLYKYHEHEDDHTDDDQSNSQGSYETTGTNGSVGGVERQERVGTTLHII